MRGSPAVSDPALVVRARRLRAARGVVVARDVTLAAAPGDVVAVEGPNGSGKSTLLAAAAGLLPADGTSVRPGSVGYAPERAGTLPRIPLQRWLLGLARTAGLDREVSARRAGDLLGRLGLAHASAVSLHALSRGNAQRALVAQALLADPDLLILDEPSGGLDADGVTRVAAEIQRAAGRRAVVLVARHPTAPLPLPSGLTWRLRDGGVDTRRRDGDPHRLAASLMEVETGDGAVRRVDEAGLPAMLRAALDAGLAVRRVQPGRTLLLLPGRATPADAGGGGSPGATAGRRRSPGAARCGAPVPAARLVAVVPGAGAAVPDRAGRRLRDGRRSPAAGRGGHRDHPGAPADLAERAGPPGGRPGNGPRLRRPRRRPGPGAPGDRPGAGAVRGAAVPGGPGRSADQPGRASPPGPAGRQDRGAAPGGGGVRCRDRLAARTDRAGRVAAADRGGGCTSRCSSSGVRR